MTSLQQDLKKSNSRVLLSASAGVVFMVGLSFAAVPLYDMFCRVTGFGGTTMVAENNLKGLIDREMSTRFDATIDPHLPLKVVPNEVVTDKLGTVRTVIYRATNLSDAPLSTTASFGVTPNLTGAYFNKIECFCFTEQVIQPNETVDMPVTFFVDPDLDQNRELRTIKQITLSYTFHAS